MPKIKKTALPLWEDFLRILGAEETLCLLKIHGISGVLKKYTIWLKTYGLLKE